MDMMKRFLKYLIIVLVFYIFSNLMTAYIMKPKQVDTSDKTETVSSVDYNWEEISRDPMFWFIALGGLIVTLP